MSEKAYPCVIFTIIRTTINANTTIDDKIITVIYYEFTSVRKAFMIESRCGSLKNPVLCFGILSGAAVFTDCSVGARKASAKCL